MIKINLALRKTASVVTSETSASTTGPFGLKLPGFLAGKAPAPGQGPVPTTSIEFSDVRSLVVGAAACYAVMYFIEGEKEKEIAELDAQVQTLQTEQTQLRAETNKIQTYEQIKKQLEADEQLMRNKLDTIKKLMEGRANSPKILLTMAQTIPPEVWLRELISEENRYTMAGSALSFNHVSDFMRGLNNSVFFQNVELKGTEEAKDTGTEVKNFELTAERRP
jgi:Tfp pilus assembly protein PilN